MRNLFGLACAAGLGLMVVVAGGVQGQEVGPHKMPVAEWGDEEYHVEVIPDAKAGTVTLVVYGNHDDLHKAKRKAIDAKRVSVAFKSPALTVKAAPAPEKDDPAGKASRFVGKAEGLEKLVKIEGTVSGKVGSKVYSGDFKQK
ncbi:hypothetical protein J0H58_09385 [bacterium]|nr:hypothetical protein [bacterium]